ncbi:MAG TPA: hypothetical protein VGH38_12995 [Bryobacteraceae bacterium]
MLSQRPFGVLSFNLARRTEIGIRVTLGAGRVRGLVAREAGLMPAIGTAAAADAAAARGKLVQSVVFGKKLWDAAV